MNERPTASHGFPTLVICGIVLTAVLALIVQRTADEASGDTAATQAPAESAAGTAPSAAEPGLAATPLTLPFGPADASRVPTPVPVAHLTGGANAAAVLALPGGSPATAALHWLDGAGVPTVVAGSLDEALGRAMIVVLGPVDDADVPRLEAYASRGGVVVLEQPASEPLLALAGIAEPDTAIRDTLVILPGGGLEATTVRFPAAETTSWGADAGALARYPEGGAAIAARQVGSGVVVALGLTLRASGLAAESGVVPPAAAPPAQTQVDAALVRDALAHLGRAIFALAPPGITLGGAPDGHAAALVLTHDIDSPVALAGAADLAAIERDRGVRATYFVNAQPAGSADAPPVLTAGAPEGLRTLQELGAEIGSAGVAFGETGDQTVGDGGEAIPGYAPTLERGGASLFGEARVSRHALVAALPGLEVESFRAPAVVAPPALDGVLAATGYTVDASVRADLVGGGLPYRLAEGHEANAEQPVLRLPLRFDDRAGLTPDRRGAELDAILESSRATGAPAVVRISPSHG